MEDSQKGIKAVGRIDLQYTKAGGATERWGLIQFDLNTKYDARNRIWRSQGNARSRTHGYEMKLTYDVSARILTVKLQNYVFTAPGTHMQAGNYNDRSTLNISFLKDVKGSIDALGDQYLIKGGSRLNLSL